jgi:hypothetical protein
MLVPAGERSMKPGRYSGWLQYAEIRISEIYSRSLRLRPITRGVIRRGRVNSVLPMPRWLFLTTIRL